MPNKPALKREGFDFNQNPETRLHFPNLWLLPMYSFQVKLGWRGMIEKERQNFSI